MNLTFRGSLLQYRPFIRFNDDSEFVSIAMDTSVSSLYSASKLIKEDPEFQYKFFLRKPQNIDSFLSVEEIGTLELSRFVELKASTCRDELKESYLSFDKELNSLSERKKDFINPKYGIDLLIHNLTEDSIEEILLDGNLDFGSSQGSSRSLLNREIDKRHLLGMKQSKVVDIRKNHHASLCYHNTTN